MEFYIFGELKKFDKITEKDINDIMSKAKQLKKETAMLKVDKIIDVFEKVSDAWGDENYEYRKAALQLLPSRIGFSKEMVAEGIKTMCSMLSRNGITIRLNSDLGNKNYLNDWTYNQYFKGLIKAEPIGLVTHVSAGNVFVGGVDSLIQGLITKNINIMKMSTVDPIFPVLFAKSLKEFDDTGILHKAMALINWKGGTESIENILKRECNAIVAYGGADTIRSYRKNLGLHCKLIEYGPKYSFVMADKNEIKKYGIKKTAELIARDGVMWEQSACSSPHTVYIEGQELAVKMMTEIGKAFDKWSVDIPQGLVFEDEAVEITKVRELAKVAKACGSGDYYFSAKSLSTVIYQKSPEFQISNHNRTLFVKSVNSLDDVVEIVEPMGQFIQTVSIIADKKRSEKLASKLALIGADRFVDAGRMAVRKHGTPHDGTKGLSELIKWVSLSKNELEADWETGALWTRYSKEKDYFDFADDKARNDITLKRLKNMVEYARKHSALLQKRYGNIEINDFDDFMKLPLLSGDDYKKHLPPIGEGLLCGDADSGYVFSSGGTTGTPKIVYRTAEEQHFNAVRLGKGLSLSVFKKGDTFANLLFAGNMWPSFISFNQALEHTGCRILPISGNISMKEITENLIRFKANAIITIPSVLLSIAEYVEKNGIDLKIDKVSTGGEHLFKEAKEYLKKVLYVKEFASTGYTTNDTGAIGYQCGYCRGGIHHVHEDLHYVEILDKNNKPCKNGEIGRIVVTNLQRKLMPTIRYEVGDLGRWIDKKCQCGRKTRLFELLGRSDDILIIGGGNIHPAVAAEAIYEAGSLSNHFQMIAEIAAKKDRLRIKIESLDNKTVKYEDKEKQIKKILYEKSKELRTMHKEGLINDIAVEITAKNSLERNPRTGKIKLVIDNRS